MQRLTEWQTKIRDLRTEILVEGIEEDDNEPNDMDVIRWRRLLALLEVAETEVAEWRISR